MHYEIQEGTVTEAPHQGLEKEDTDPNLRKTKGSAVPIRGQPIMRMGSLMNKGVGSHTGTAKGINDATG